MASPVLLELVAVGAQDRIAMLVGEQLLVPTGTPITFGRHPGCEVHCHGFGQGGRRCLTVAVVQDGVIVQHLGHSNAIFVDGRAVSDREPVVVGVGHTFGPSAGMAFRVVAVLDRLGPPRLVGPGLAFLPLSTGEVTCSVGFRSDDMERTVVDIVEVPEDADVIDFSAACRSHPALPVRTEVGVVDGTRIWLQESTRGVTLDAVVDRTHNEGAAIDPTLAAWLVESVGRALLDAPTYRPHPSLVTIRCDDGQPLVGSLASRFYSGWPPVPEARHLAVGLIELLTTMLGPIDTWPSTLTAAGDASASAADIVERLSAQRGPTGGELRAAWQALVHGLFPDAVAHHRAVVEELGLVALPPADVLRQAPRLRSRRLP